ncbi:MAG: lipid A deacylase LpxR family protein [Planctomycetota bacterium]|jgi:hypothetical protein
MTTRLLLLFGILSSVVSAQGVEDALAETPAWTDPSMKKKPAHTGTLTFLFENDTFASQSDNNYTAGIGAAWTSAPIHTLGLRNVFRNLVEDYWSFLPTLADPNYKKFVQLNFIMEIYTSTDIDDPDPPPGDHPYSGVLALDLAVYSSNEKHFNAYIVRMGLVGPAVGGGQAQNFMHRLTGRDEVAGWADQLANEPLLNLFYIHQWRVFRWTAGEQGIGIDAAINGGAGLGNYYTGANIGAQVRIGFALPANFARSNAFNFMEELVDFPPQKGRVVAYVYAQTIAVAIGRFLPIDGNTFQDSASGDRDDFDIGLYVGAAIAYDRFVATFQFTPPGSGTLAQDDDYAIVSASWIF